jgi:CubicO group peptidase (beta-lactamase class C family)
MRLYGKKILTLFILSLGAITGIFAQTLSDSLAKKIDSLFSELNTSYSPGCAIGIVSNDSLIYAKGYGMANLEYNIPNSPQTIFHMASVSKQFTAYSIVLLARQGKLKLDDDIHKYLSWFPDLKEKITVRNLLNHTSGIRDQWQLLAISGTRIDDVITQDHIVKVLSKQRELNFKPGEQYSYSNSGFTMLAEIVKSVSGQSLRQFTDSAIFKPLGMTNTRFHDNYTEIVPNRSYSYERKDSLHFQNDILSYSNAGATSLFTNVNDMSKWVMNFFNPKVGDQKDILQLTQNGKLNSGKELSYALGIAVDTYKGWKQYSHGGGDAGYRTYITVLPDIKMGFIVFSNMGDFNPGGKIYEIADLFVKDSSHHLIAADKKEKRDSMSAILRDPRSLKKFSGRYIAEEGLEMSFETKTNKLHCFFNNQDFLLVPEKKDSFSLLVDPGTKFIFRQKMMDTTVDIVTPDKVYHLKKYVRDSSQSDKYLKAYTGIYYSPELDCKYGIVLKEHHLVLTNSKYNDARLTLIGKDHLLNDNWWMNHLRVLRNSTGKITGFEVNSDRIMHLRFDKM